MRKEPKDITLYLSGPQHANTHKQMNWMDFTDAAWGGKTIRPATIGERGKDSQEPLNDLCQGILELNLIRIEQADAMLVLWQGGNVTSAIEMYHASHVLKRPVFLINQSGNGSISVYIMACVAGVAGALDTSTLKDIMATLQDMDLNGTGPAH